ncbi:hypothetical protein BS78_09G091200 [Paspalum vaginatum]|nr:hypothetical protein BS78_09G091200 [Paspalum vaginatum]
MAPHPCAPPIAGPACHPLMCPFPWLALDAWSTWTQVQMSSCHQPLSNQSRIPPPPPSSPLQKALLAPPPLLFCLHASKPRARLSCFISTGADHGAQAATVDSHLHHLPVASKRH